MNDSRLKIVKEAFKKADRSGDGVFDANDMKRVYKVTEHPKYKNGEWDETQVFTEFLKSFEPDVAKRDGKVCCNSDTLRKIFHVQYTLQNGALFFERQLAQKNKYGSLE